MFEEEPYDHLPPDLLLERKLLIEEIFAAFDGISRDGGVSWTEAQLLDNFASPEECAAGRAEDQEPNWQALLEDLRWNHPDGFEWCFLDATGFAYYLPAGMMRSIQAGDDQGVGLILSVLCRDMYYADREEWGRSPLDLRQALVVKRFLKYMKTLAPEDKVWLNALAEGWDKVDGTPAVPARSRVSQSTDHVNERNALKSVIFAAFGHVTREGGVSWRETVVVDDNGSDIERVTARLKDTENCWQELIDDDSWDPEMGVGGWPFLDAVGFRYYLPAAMIRSLDTGFDVGIQSCLTLPRYSLRSHTLQQWSALDPGQKYAISRFIRFMRTIDFYREGWRNAFASYWESLPKLDR